MTMIFSPTSIEGLNGTYAVAGLATEIDIAHADVVYTDSERIIAMANKLNIEVRDFPKHPPTGKEATSPKPLKIEVNVSANVEKAKNTSIDEIGDVLTPLVMAEQPKEGVLTATSVPEVKSKRKPLSPEAKAKAAEKRKAKALEKKKNKK